METKSTGTLTAKARCSSSLPTASEGLPRLVLGGKYEGSRARIGVDRGEGPRERSIQCGHDAAIHPFAGPGGAGSIARGGGEHTEGGVAGGDAQVCGVVDVLLMPV